MQPLTRFERRHRFKNPVVGLLPIILTLLDLIALLDKEFPEDFQRILWSKARIVSQTGCYFM
jgi:hypothetical protein